MKNDYRKKLDRLLADYHHVRRTAREERKRLREARSQLTYALDAQQFLQSVAERTQQQAHRQIAAVVTRCLRAVFGEQAYEFKIDFRQARGKTEARLLLVRDGLEIDAVDAAGGGVVDIVSLGLRIACLILGVPRRRRLLVLDEPLKHLSASYIPKARELLERLSEEFGVQIVLITHNQGLVCGEVVELE